MHKNKQCKTCGKMLPITAFYLVHNRYYRSECKTCFLKVQRGRIKSWEGRNKDRRTDYRKRLLHKLRIEALRAYGGKCKFCGQDNLKFLTFDHIHNDGAKQKKIHGVTGQFVMWLKRNNYPKDIRVLCWNCNCSRQFWRVYD
jgi:DNA repair exonuclease SbcCD ATPase subunit